MVSKVLGAWFREHGVHGFELGVHSTWLREYGVPAFEGTGYMVSKILGTWFRAWGT